MLLRASDRQSRAALAAWLRGVAAQVALKGRRRPRTARQLGPPASPVRVSAALVPSMCVPPSMVLMPSKCLIPIAPAPACATLIVLDMFYFLSSKFVL